ncbi:MAG: FKBP-type peptidyl-prolyl cis-trans isomerase [Janthinobacterium lividum]
MRHLFFGLGALLVAQLATAQTVPAPGFSTLPGSSTEYRLFRRDAAGHYAPKQFDAATDAPYASRAGQVLLVHLQYRTDRDSLLMDSRQRQRQPLPVGLPPAPPRHGSLEEAMSLLTPSDSAVFRFQADSAFKQMGQEVPPFIRRTGNALRLTVVPQELLTMEQMQTRQQAMMAEQEKMRAEQQRMAKAHAAGQLVKDDATIQAYLKEHKLTLKAKKTAGGTWYVITKRGTGALPQKGQTVSVKYRGTILATGKEFDSTAKHGDTPFDFVLGQGMVIQGWDQGIAALPKGSTATLYIPSPLGYGERGAGADIPANAILSFDVELTNITGAATAAPAAKAPVKKVPVGTKKAPVKKAPAKKK